MDNDEMRLRHLEMIQGVISRMAQNSFAVKTWTVTLVAGLFALAADKTNPGFVLIAYIPMCAFWILDAFFLWQERLFRKLFDEARKSSGAVDYSLHTMPVVNQVDSWQAIVFSNTLLIFYGVLGGTILVAMIAIMQLHVHSPKQ